MIIKNRLLLSVAVAVGGVLAGWCGDTSPAAFVTLAPDQTPFWRTATNATIEVCLDYPPLATSARIDVTGLGVSRRDYSASYADLTGETFIISLPPATSRREENTYELIVTYSDGTVKSCRVGVVMGAGRGAGTYEVRCVTDTASSDWSRVPRRVTFPIAYGTESVELDGATVESGLDGAAGWMTLRFAGGSSHELTVGDGEPTELTAETVGLAILLK